MRVMCRDDAYILVDKAQVSTVPTTSQAVILARQILRARGNGELLESFEVRNVVLKLLLVESCPIPCAFPQRNGGAL